MNYKGKQNSEKIQRFKIRLTLGSYVIKPCKWDQKITYSIRLAVTSRLSYKNHVRITSEGFVRLPLGSSVIKSCKWDQKIT